MVIKRRVHIQFSCFECVEQRPAKRRQAAEAKAVGGMKSVPPGATWPCID